MSTGTCGGVPCTCPLHADECDSSYGVFFPGTANGDCAVRPCQKPQPAEDRRYRNDFERRPTWLAYGVKGSDHG